MKAILTILMLWFANTAIAQQVQKIWGDPHVVQKFSTEATKTPAYTKLQADIDALSKDATPGKNNATAVQAILQKNAAILKGLYTKAGLEAPRAMSAKRKLNTPQYMYIRNSILSKLKMTNQSLTKTETPPYDDAWRRTGGHSNDGNYPDSSASTFNTGKLTMVANTVSSCATNQGWGGCKLGYYKHGYTQKFTVPANPEIIAAQVKFEYEWLYTGWDTYGAITGLDLIVRADNKLNGTSYNALPDAPPGAEFGTQNDRWKKMATLYALDSVNADFDEFHGNGTSSFTIEGYVTPGTDFEVMLGMGFPKDTRRGINGCYHYAEFRLKKITVMYYKNGQ